MNIHRYIYLCQISYQITKNIYLLWMQFIIFLTLNFFTAQSNKANELGFNLKHSFLSEFNSASEQAGKLELGQNKTVICYYSNNQVCI